MENIEKFNYLWTTKKDRFIVERYKSDYFIMDKIDRKMLLIEDEELYVAIVHKMIEQGNEVIELE